MDFSITCCRGIVIAYLFLTTVGAQQIAPECGTATFGGRPLVGNGTTPRLGPFPWFVGVYVRTGNESCAQICGGTLVSPDLVISAAHCFYNENIESVRNASKFTIAGGKFYRSYDSPEPYAQKSTVKSITLSERYIGRSGNYAHDIALVRLETPFNLTEQVKPVCIHWDNRYESEQLRSGKTGKVLGWGITEMGDPSETLKEIDLPYVPYEICSAGVPTGFRAFVATEDKFCAENLTGSGVCNGDGGGGLCFLQSGRWYLRGILSTVPTGSIDHPCDNVRYVALTNVGHFRQWVHDAYSSTE